MTEPTGTRDHVRILNGIVHCAHCSAPLLKAGTNYSCPTVIADRVDACPTKPIDGQETTSSCRGSDHWPHHQRPDHGPNRCLPQKVITARGPAKSKTT